MLSRFNKLPRLSRFLSASNYPQETIDNAVSEIKKLGKRPINGDDSLKDIQQILKSMQKYSESVHVQRVGCHALSNLAMQAVAAHWIIQKGGFKVIQKAVTKFMDDHKLCWLASSAVWNLARPMQNRPEIGADGAKMMLDILYTYRNREKVTNTAIGALSNLSLCDELKDFIAQPHHLDLIIGVLGQYIVTKSVCVMTSGAGLIANLAVSDLHAATLVSRHCLPILLNLLNWTPPQNDDTLHRNTCAALNNMVSAEGFLPKFLEANGLEHIYEFLQNSSVEMYHNLLDNCLVNLGADRGSQTTSFHMAVFNNQINVLKVLVKRNPDFALDTVDQNQMTCLDYAVSREHLEIVAFLTKCGASKCNQSSNLSEETTERDAACKAIEDGMKVKTGVIAEHRQVIRATLKQFPTDLCDYMSDWVSLVDKLDASNKY